MKPLKLLPLALLALGSVTAALRAEESDTPADLSVLADAPVVSTPAPLPIIVPTEKLPASAEKPRSGGVREPFFMTMLQTVNSGADDSPLDCCDFSSYPGFRLVGGAGLYLMEARFDNNLAYGIQGTSGRTGNAPGTRSSVRVDINHDVMAAPQAWLGFVHDSGFGARARFWYFREGTDQLLAGGQQGGPNTTLLTSAAPLGLSLNNIAPPLSVTSKLQVAVGDAEGTYQFTPGKWNVVLASGVRFARVDQAYNAYSTQAGNRNLQSSSLFNGAGPSIALELRRPICQTGFNFYGSVRYALVFGDADQQAKNIDQNLFAEDHRHVGVGISELELGLEYRQPIGRSQLFGQVAVVGQNWSGVGSASRSSVNVVPGGAFVGAGYTGESDLNFLGLAFRLGVNY